MAQTFFGPSEGLREEFLEQAYILQRHLNMSYSDIRSLPLPYRRWFIERLSDEFKKTSEAKKKASDERQGLRDIPMGEMAQMMGGIVHSPLKSINLYLYWTSTTSVEID